MGEGGGEEAKEDTEGGAGVILCMYILHTDGHATCKCIYIYTHTHTCTHAHIRTYTHAHIGSEEVGLSFQIQSGHRKQPLVISCVSGNGPRSALIQQHNVHTANKHSPPTLHHHCTSTHPPSPLYLDPPSITTVPPPTLHHHCTLHPPSITTVPHPPSITARLPCNHQVHPV